MRVRFSRIEWDTDGEVVDLPTEVILDDVDPETDLEEEAADLLSDKYGWLVKSVSYEVLPDDQAEPSPVGSNTSFVQRSTT